MNTKGQVALYKIMVAIMIFIIAIIIITPIKDSITWARSADNMDCDNSSISTGTKMACIVTDVQLPYYIGIIFSLGIAVLVGKKYKESIE